MNPRDVHQPNSSGWLQQIDRARQEKKRVDRLNSLRRGSTKPLPKWAEAKHAP